MSNYYRGEKILIKGKLTDDNIETSNYNLYLQIYKNGSPTPVDSILFTKENNDYSVIIDTTTHYGVLLLRFVLKSNDETEEDIVVSKNDIRLVVNDFDYTMKNGTD